MRALVGLFYELNTANMLLHMPRADYSRVHTAATQRFTSYTQQIIGVINANTNDELQDANLALMSILDENLQVERGAFDRALAGMMIGAVLVDYANKVKNTLGSVRRTS